MTLLSLLDCINVCAPKSEDRPWWSVEEDHPDGTRDIIAFFKSNNDAHRFRLDYINRKLNP